MKYSEIERIVRKAGCYCINERGKHPEWFSPITGKAFHLSHHKSEEAKKGTKHQISKLSGIWLS
jgi:predicted RNA binding protein YcfA (HicA-like mRNA interferase family)